MNDDMRRFMAKTSPKSLKSVIHLAKYGTLPDSLTVGEVAELWSKEGLEKKTPAWSEIVEFLTESIKSNMLACNNRSVAFGGINKSWAQYEAIASRLGYQLTSCADKYYDPKDAEIASGDLKRFLDENGGLHLVKEFLINRWWLSELNPEDEEFVINPAHAGSPAFLLKDKDALELLKTKPHLLECGIKREVKEALQKYSPEFKKGFEDWWRSQDIFKKVDRGGRPKGR